MSVATRCFRHDREIKQATNLDRVLVQPMVRASAKC
jgi:hypothetical protein